MLALIPGHSENRKGMITYDGQMEYDWNQSLLVSVKKKLNKANIDSIILKRTESRYSDYIENIRKKIKEKKITKLIEFHLNAFNGQTKIIRSEFLYHEDSLKSFKAGLDWGYLLKKEYDIEKLNPISIEDKSEKRGSDIIELGKEMGLDICLLLEPCFADTKNLYSEKIIEDKNKYCEIIFKWLVNINGK
jgi:hypothetical protein